MENKVLTDNECQDLLMQIYGARYFIPKKELYYGKEDLDAIRTHKGCTEAIEKIYGAVNDEAAKDLSEDDNATVSWFDETIPEASDITNLMMAEAVCATAIDKLNKEQGLI